MSKTYRARLDLSPLDAAIERLPLADLPTPLREYRVDVRGRRRTLFVKLDNLTSDLYGGNKVRKLEYILPLARTRDRRLIATFGTVGSHHALATAINANHLGYPCTSFLSHQHRTAEVAAVLAAHVALGTNLVPYVGDYAARIAILRGHLWGRDALVVAPGGSSWLGTFGFVQAGRELATQVARGLMPAPDRLYVATGTMSTAAGLALGLALAGLATQVQAVRVSHTWLCNEDSLHRTMTKATAMMRRIAPTIPADLPERANVRLRHGFFAGGYAHTDERTEAAIVFAASQLDLTLESTYTGKAMAALLHDLAGSDARCLFWNTYNSARLPQAAAAARAATKPPPAFSRYFS